MHLYLYIIDSYFVIHVENTDNVKIEVMFTNKYKGVSKLLHIGMWYDCQWDHKQPQTQ